MADFLLSPQQIQKNWKTFRDIVNEISPSRKDVMNRMYDEMEERVCMAPASSIDYFHNAMPGGYVDHVLRVYHNTITHYDMWKQSGMVVDNFTLEELSFAAIHHDLGKIGMPGENKELYQKNSSEWHRKNQGKIYQMNPNIAYMENTARTFYLLNHYGIQYSQNEMFGIQLTDGMYNEANKIYLTAYDIDKKLRNNMGIILHHADLMAARFEFEQWAITTGRFDLNTKAKQPTPIPTNGTPKVRMDLFKEVFPDLA